MVDEIDNISTGQHWHNHSWWLAQAQLAILARLNIPHAREAKHKQNKSKAQGIFTQSPKGRYIFQRLQRQQQYKMLAPIKHLLAKKRIILASGSPRRQELVKSLVRNEHSFSIEYPNLNSIFHSLSKQGVNAELCPSTFEENLNPADFKDFSKFIEATALGKAEEVYNRLKNGDNQEELLVIAADTMVTMGSEIYGKPKNSDDAFRMLSKWAN